jgi:hypothetical protein
MSKYGRYSIDEWKASFKSTKTDSGSYKVTTSLKQFKDKSWEGTSETEALKRAKAEIDETVQKSN